MSKKILQNSNGMGHCRFLPMLIITYRMKTWRAQQRNGALIAGRVCGTELNVVNIKYMLMCVPCKQNTEEERKSK